MAKYVQKRHKELIQKQEILNKAKVILKQEFIGIDQVIEEVVDALSSWYLFPDLQEKPVIINLWGLTGVGKSSLVNRLARLIDFNNKFYHFDLGENDTGNWAIKSQLEEIYENINGYPVLLALDEAQHARTIDESGMEVAKNSTRIMWQLLDSGRFQISRSTYHLEDIYDLIQKLRHLLNNGVRVSKGKVISKKKYFAEQMNLEREPMQVKSPKIKEDSNNTSFVPLTYHEGIYSLAKEKFSSYFDVQEKLNELNGHETLKFLYDIFSIGNSPRYINCSKGLIFVLGNLDEAYTMSHDFNPDMDADEFHEQSLKINVPIIKKALQKRFRNEQISRFGNIHIIYPSFSKKSFRDIIKLELASIAHKVKIHQKIDLQFDQSIHDLIYREGVYPTQGTRPVFTTIHQIISSTLGRVITEMILKHRTTRYIVFRTKDNNIIADYYDKKVKIGTLSIQQQLNLGNLRKGKQDDVQAITAVHESGHAIISVILLKTVPEVIYSNTAKAGAGGFVYAKFKWEYVSRKEITKRLALFLGGLAAEKIIFGKENITTGAEEDIEKATSFITEMLKQCGMGKLPVAYHAKAPQTRYFVHDAIDALSKESETWISKAMTLAEKTLREQEALLLKMADYLSDKPQMGKRQVTQLLEMYAQNFDCDTLIENGDLLFYRNHLKNKVQKIKNGADVKISPGTFNFSLNTKTNR